jgi:molecular chaperone GrpE
MVRMGNNMVGDADENGEEAFTSEDTELEALRKELDDTRRSLAAENAKCREVLDLAKRIQADFDNYKKRVVREREDIVRAANDKLVLELLSTLDDLDRATEIDWDEAELRVGIGQVRSNFLSLLKGQGLREIPNEMFDPQYHEAFSVGEGEEGAVIEVYQKGYCLGPRVLRHSKVKVGKSKEKGE